MQISQDLVTLYPTLIPMLEVVQQQSECFIFMAADYLYENEWYAQILAFMTKAVSVDTLFKIFSLHLDMNVPGMPQLK